MPWISAMRATTGRTRGSTSRRAARPGGPPVVPAWVERLEGRRLFDATAGAGFEAHINFQPAAAAPVGGYDADVGRPYGPQADGLTYGWDRKMTTKARVRHSARSSDPRYDTFVAMSGMDWRIAVPNGMYNVRVVVGDPNAAKGRYQVDVDDTPAVAGTAARDVRWFDGTATVAVTDGTLTLSGPKGAKVNPLDFIDIIPAAVGDPTPTVPPPTPAPTPEPPAVTGLMLVNAGTGADIGPLADEAALDLSAVGPALSVRAETAPADASTLALASVVFSVDGAVYHVENRAPYTILGDDAATGVYDAWTPADGAHTLTATPYSEPDGAGTAGPAMTVSFTVTNSPGAAPAAPFVAWAAGPSSPQSRVEAGVTRLGSKLYIFGGFTTGLDVNNQTDVFDAATMTWTREADFPGSETHAAVATDGVRYIYKVAGQIGGSIPGTPTADAWRLDTQTGEWSALPPLPAARYAGGMAYLDNKLYFFGGDKPDRTTITTNLWVLDLSNTSAGWVAKAPLPKGGDHMSTEVIDGQIYSIGGEHGHATKVPDNGTYVQHNYLFRYDPATDKWTRLADLPSGRSHAEGDTLVIDNKIVLMGGKLNPTDFSHEIDVYDPATDRWTVSATTLPQDNEGGAAIYYDGRIFLTDGQDGAPDYTNYTTTWVGVPHNI